MGPTNVALVKLYRANEALREAQGRLDAASKNVRLQERKVNDLTEKVKSAHAELRELQSKGGQFELDIKTREARIEKLRLQQQTTTNNRDYQVFLLEIGSEKVDRGKSEDELLKVMEAIETSQAALKELTDQLESEKEKLTALKTQIGQTLSKLQAEVDALKPARDEAGAALPPRVLQTFDRLAERYEGEALSALGKPDRRREEYLCGGCHLNLVADVYNRLHTRDELISCTSCGRVLYIPEDLPPEVAINSRGRTESPKEGSYGAAAPKTKRAKTVERLDPADRRAKGKLGDVLAKAAGESMRIAAEAGLKGIECEVIVDGKPQGTYKGRSGEHLQRCIALQMEESGVKGTAEARDKASVAGPESAEAASTADVALPESAPAESASTELQTQGAPGGSSDEQIKENGA